MIKMRWYVAKQVTHEMVLAEVYRGAGMLEAKIRLEKARWRVLQISTDDGVTWTDVPTVECTDRN